MQISSVKLDFESSIENKSVELLERRSKQRQLSGIHRSKISDKLENIEIKRRSRNKIQNSQKGSVITNSSFKKPKKRLKITLKNASKHFSNITSNLDAKISDLKAEVRSTSISLKKKEKKAKYFAEVLSSFDQIIEKMNSKINLSPSKASSLREFLIRNGVPIGNRFSLSKSEHSLASELKTSIEAIEYLNKIQKIRLNNIILLSKEFSANLDIFMSKQPFTNETVEFDCILREEWGQIVRIQCACKEISENKRELFKNTQIMADQIFKQDSSCSKLSNFLLNSLVKACQTLIRQEEQSTRKESGEAYFEFKTRF